MNNTVIKKNSSEKVQKFGRFLSGMVMPNIGAFIAWGLITALFIPTGWLPNANIATLVGPMITYLLPLLIGFTGGRMVYGNRGGVLGAIATMGVIVGASIPMFIGGMIMGPVSGYLMKKVDEKLEDIVPTGFEMLVNNFSAGILGGALAIIAYMGIGPVVEGLSAVLGNLVEGVVAAGLLPIASIFIEPAKVLFLNNAINHGVLSPLGIKQATEVGKSVFFLLETNPGPGLGILLTYWVFSKGAIKQSAPGAMIIHFLGGIHEIYFPYILMQPKLILAAIAGGASGVFTFTIFGAGLVATPSPGSIFALLAMTPKGGWFSIIAGVLISTVVSFLVGSLLIDKKNSDEDLEKAKNQSKDMKAKKIKTVKEENKNELIAVDTLPTYLYDYKSVRKIAIACDAGMGSSAMGASKLKIAIKKLGLSIDVNNYAIENIPKDSDIIITHQNLAKRALNEIPFGLHLSTSDFITTPLYESLLEELKVNENTIVEEVEIKEYVTLTRENIKIGLESVDKESAIRMAGQILFDAGYVESEYIDAMVQRDTELSTFIGNGTAIPHGVSEAKKRIKHTGISILQFPEGVDFDGNIVYLVVGIAGIGNEHLKILANLAEIVEDEEKVELLRRTTEKNYIYKLFTN
jgi:PTS system mannitol-specific IIC component